MAGKDNLTPYKKGQSGNPTGKIKGTKNRATIIKEVLALSAADGIYDEINIAQALIDKAKEGDIAAIKEFHDTMHGKITDTSFNINTDTDEDHIPTKEMKAAAADIVKSLTEDY